MLTFAPERVREARLEAGIGQTEMARRIGQDRVTLWRFEKGISEPGATVLGRMSEELGVPIEAFFVRTP